VRGRRLISLSPIEETLLLWQEAAVPWNAQVALGAPHIDPERARQAYNAAIARHPLAGCAIECDDRGGFHWVRDRAADIGEIAVIECPDEASLQRVRLDQLERPLAMDVAPLIRAVVARCPTQDILISCISHVMTDGLGVLRLMRSVGRAYRDEPDPAPAVDIAAAHRALIAEPPTSWTALTDRLKQRLQVASTQVRQRSRLASSGESPDGGFGLVLRTVDPEAVARARRNYDAGFDAYAMAALHVTIQAWNDAHDAPCELIGVTQGVNLRPDEWWDDVVVNLAAFASVMTEPADRVDVATALTTVVPQLDPDLRLKQARELTNAARAARLVPAATRRRGLAALPANQFDTCAISNAGVLSDPPRLVDNAQSLSWIVTPAMPAAGLTIGTTRVGDELQFNACYRRERFDEAGANAFIDAFIASLTTA
jgi:NRPS condensation-like uncharacterized protein